MHFDDWMRDLRHATRALLRTPGFTFMAVGTLGLAIGANAGMFSVVNNVLLNPLPYGNADRLVYIAAAAPGSDMPPEFGVSAEFFIQYKEQSRLLEDVSTVQLLHVDVACWRPSGADPDVCADDVPLHDARREAGHRPPSGT